MRRLALLAAAVLAVAVAPAARAEQLDIDLSRLGAPDPSVWVTALGASAPQADALARGARQRFAILSTQVALALSSAVLQPAATTGHSGFALDLEVATVSASADPVGATTTGYAATPWAGTRLQPSALYVPSVHVRKGLPFSFEVGGRLLYLAMSNAYAAQAEAKFAAIEGLTYLPDLAVRGAYTRLFGVRDWNLSAADLDLMLSKRFGFMGVTSLTPYAAARLTWVNASSDRILFAPAGPAPDLSTSASFPNFSAMLYRTTAGVRFTAYSVSLALEGTYFAGASPSAKGYEGVKLPSSLGGAAKLGWEW